MFIVKVAVGDASPWVGLVLSEHLGSEGCWDDGVVDVGFVGLWVDLSGWFLDEADLVVDLSREFVVSVPDGDDAVIDGNELCEGLFVASLLIE